ncbi:MAG: hypothetical protein KDC71_04970 [Acidobacteria bacterium]|nr:hypothetical protein [Acidobacteriota bacterium]
MLGDPEPVVKDIKVTFEPDALTRFYSPTLGMAYGRSLDSYELTNGFKFKIEGRWTCLMEKQNGEWKISAFHYSANLFNNPILDSYKTKIPALAMGVAGIGLAVGGLLGWLIGKGRKKV